MVVTVDETDLILNLEYRKNVDVKEKRTASHGPGHVDLERQWSFDQTCIMVAHANIRLAQPVCRNSTATIHGETTSYYII